MARIAERAFDRPDDESVGGVIRTHFVLRDDGAIMKSHSYPHHPSEPAKRSHPRLVAMVKPTATEPVERVFEAYVLRIQKKSLDT